MNVFTKRLSVLIPAILIACSTQGNSTKIITNYDVSEVNKLCAKDIAYDGCADLDGRYFVIKGRLFTDIVNHPTIYPPNTMINDFESDKEPNGINLLVNNEMYETLGKLNGKLVSVSGTLFTDCVLKYRDARSHEQTINASLGKNNEGDIVIVMLTGTCHYVGRFITDPKVELFSHPLEKRS